MYGSGVHYTSTAAAMPDHVMWHGSYFFLINNVKIHNNFTYDVVLMYKTI